MTPIPAISEWKPSLAKASIDMAARLAKDNPFNWRPTPSEDADGNTTEAALFESLTSASVTVAQLSMHLGADWRTNVLQQLRALLSIENWDDDSNLLDTPSVRSFLRFVIYGDVQRLPHLGINNKRELTATWIWEDRRIYMDFGFEDSCRAIFSHPGKFGPVRHAFAGKVGDAVGTLSTNGFDLTKAS